MTALPHTPADIVSLIRATNGSEFALSGSEAELLVSLFASAAAADEPERVAQRASDRALAVVNNEGRGAPIFQNGV